MRLKMLAAKADDCTDNVYSTPESDIYTQDDFFREAVLANIIEEDNINDLIMESLLKEYYAEREFRERGVRLVYEADDQIFRDYAEKYPDLYYRYEGKPLLMCYGATPNFYGADPVWTDDRFTVRWVTGYVGQQPPLFDSETMRSHRFWSWEERGTQTYTVKDGRVECISVTASSREQVAAEGLEFIPARGRRNGETFREQFNRARELGAGTVLLISWNEWTTSEQLSVEISKDLEPSVIHGTFYYDLMKEQIALFKGQE